MWRAPRVRTAESTDATSARGPCHRGRRLHGDGVLEEAPASGEEKPEAKRRKFFGGDRWGQVLTAQLWAFAKLPAKGAKGMGNAHTETGFKTRG